MEYQFLVHNRLSVLPDSKSGQLKLFREIFSAENDIYIGWQVSQ